MCSVLVSYTWSRIISLEITSVHVKIDVVNPRRGTKDYAKGDKILKQYRKWNEIMKPIKAGKKRTKEKSKKEQM